jgi:hypothetical protein
LYAAISEEEAPFDSAIASLRIKKVRRSEGKKIRAENKIRTASLLFPSLSIVILGLFGI